MSKWAYHGTSHDHCILAYDILSKQFDFFKEKSTMRNNGPITVCLMDTK